MRNYLKNFTSYLTVLAATISHLYVGYKFFAENVHFIYKFFPEIICRVFKLMNSHFHVISVETFLAVLITVHVIKFKLIH